MISTKLGDYRQLIRKIGALSKTTATIKTNDAMIE
jgi:hypothetical protein